jgi:formate dehydrogenase subunit gamma
MAQPSLISAARLCIAALGLAVVCSAAAQSPAVSPREADQAKQQAAQQLAQPLNNQPLWNEVRTGQPQYTSIPGRETNILVQPQGQTWRAVRTPIATFGGILLAVVLLGLAGYYAWRGTITLHGKKTGRMIERFTPLKRYTHWTMGLTFVALGITGLILTFGKTALLPLIGSTLFSWLAILAKNIHNFVGPVFSVALFIFIVLFVRDNLPRAYDVKWIARFGGMLDRSGNTHVPSGKFNAGEKALFWGLVVVFCMTLVITGYILNFPNFNQTRATMQVANVVHMSVALVAIAMACFHIYLGTVGMEGALDAMRTGYVDETWAKEHHEYWYNDAKPGKVLGGDAPDTAAGQYAS